MESETTDTTPPQTTAVDHQVMVRVFSMNLTVVKKKGKVGLSMVAVWRGGRILWEMALAGVAVLEGPIQLKIE
jgi:hypothetical protein